MKFIKGKNDSSAALMNYMINRGGKFFTEELCFGIGQGLSFSYYKDDEKKLIAVSNPSLLECFSDNMEFLLNINCISEFETSIKRKIQVYIKSHNPIIVLLNDGYGEEIGNHVSKSIHKRVVLLSEINEDEVTIYNPIVGSKEKYKWNKFIELGCKLKFNSDFSAPIAYIIDDRVDIKNMKEIIIDAINDTAYRMLNPTNFNCGLQGLKNFYDDVSQDKHLFYKSLKGINEIEKETGLLRSFYADFLKQAAEITGIQQLEKVAAEYVLISEGWKQLFYNFNEKNRAEIKDILLENYLREKELCEKILEIQF